MKFIYSFIVAFVIINTVSTKNESKQKKVNRDKRIVGGSIADVKDFKHQIMLEKKVEPIILFRDYVSICGGSILTENYVLTAGHCIQKSDTYRIKTGISFRYDLFAQIAAVEEAIVHPDYKGPSIMQSIVTNDIAVLKLANRLIFNSKVGNIRLPQPNSQAKEAIARLSGWGRMNSVTTIPTPFLQFADIPVISNAACQKALKSAGDQNATILDTHVCTLESTDIKAPCNGDSGSALVQDDHIIGIVSWASTPCDKKRGPAVYTRVSKFVGWIRKNIRT